MTLQLDRLFCDFCPQIDSGLHPLALPSPLNDVFLAG